MKAILVIVAIVLILAVIGWISFGTNGDRASMTIESDRIRHDTREAAERGREAVNKARRSLREEAREERREEQLEDERRNDAPPVLRDETTQIDRGRAASTRVL